MNFITAADLKRRGMAVIEEHLRRGPVRLLKHNKPAAVVVSEAEYARLALGRRSKRGVTALQWLLRQTPAKPRSRRALDQERRSERGSWV